MRVSHLLGGIRTKLLLSYLLAIAAAIGGVHLGVLVLGPSLFDRMLTRHLDPHSALPSELGTIEVMRDTMSNAFRDAILQALVVSTAVAIIVAVLISIFVSRRITAPLRRVITSSHEIAAGDYRVRVEVTHNDEIGELATTFNKMAEALEDTEQRRVQLIGDVAHELRTPLSTLRGNLEGLLDGVIEPEPRLWAQLHDETTRLSRLVHDLQELSRVESGQMPLHVQPVSPAHLVERALASLSPQYTEKGVDVHMRLTDGVSKVAGDEDRTIQVLTNLLANALRYTPSGGSVTVSTWDDADTVYFRVRDTGTGISAEHLPHVFDRFYRVDRARSRALGGSGVGLSIAKALVEAQGGQIWAESAGLEQGSTFTFTLPRGTWG